VLEMHGSRALNLMCEVALNSRGLR
jgi:hypothetical protein